jgi:hypothetical protein
MMMRRKGLALGILVLWIMGCQPNAVSPRDARGAAPAAGVQGRLRPPDAVKCDRNQLTSFSGAVTQWSRNANSAQLSMDTDSGTKEAFTLRFDKAAPVENWFLLGGELFRDQDWQKVELSVGRLRPGIQAIVWICEGAANPIIDWRLPPQ